MNLVSLRLWRGHELLPDVSKPLLGKAKFQSDHGEVEIRLSEDTAMKILAICASGIVEAAQAVAKDMTAEVLTQQLTDRSEKPALA